MKRSQWTAFCALALLLFSAMPVGAFEIGVRGYYWFPGFKTDMKSDSDGLTGSDINLKDTLDIGNKAFPSVEVFGGLGKTVAELILISRVQSHQDGLIVLLGRLLVLRVEAPV